MLSSPGSSRFNRPRTKARPQFPSQAGTSCEAGPSTARTRDGQPSPKQQHPSTSTDDRGGVDASQVFRRQAVPAPPNALPAPGSGSALRVTRRLQGRSSPHKRIGSTRPARKGRPISSTERSLTTVADPPAAVPLDQHPRSPLHSVSAHPPCSRKGPLLPACGLKRPRRVKRETTNSRFFVLR